MFTETMYHHSTEDLKSKFLSCPILDFYWNHVLPSRQFLNLITHTQLVGNIFGTTYLCEKLFLKTMHRKGTLRSQLLNNHLSELPLILHTLNCIRWRDSSSVNLKSVEYYFTDITPKTTLNWSAEAQYRVIFKTFFSLINPIFGKKCDKSKYTWLALLFKDFLKIKIQPNMSEKEKKRQIIYDLLNAEPNFLCRPYTKQRKKYTAKEFFNWKGGVKDWIKNERSLTVLATAIKDSIASIRKHVNELKVDKTTVRTAIKHHLSSDLNPLDCAIWGVLEKKEDILFGEYFLSPVFHVSIFEKGKRSKDVLNDAHQKNR